MRLFFSGKKPDFRCCETSFFKEGGLTAAVKHLIELNTPGGTPTVSSFFKHNYFTAISSNNPPRKVLNEKYEFVRGI